MPWSSQVRENARQPADWRFNACPKIIPCTHTKDDLREANVGDLLMGGWLGGMVRSGQPGFPYYADDLGQIRASVKKVLDLGATKFFVGHGGPLDAGRVWEWLERVGGGGHEAPRNRGMGERIMSCRTCVNGQYTGE